jgi:hypothetical protein
VNDREYKHSGAAFVARKYGLTREQAIVLQRHPQRAAIVRRIEEFTTQHGCTSSSPLARGVLLDAIR